jgi:hypothetical protein
MLTKIRLRLIEFFLGTEAYYRAMDKELEKLSSRIRAKSGN